MQPIVSNFSFKSLFIPLTNLKAITIIIFVGIIVYANMLFNAFVADDITLILLNPTVQSFANIPNLFFQSHSNASGSYYIPLTTIVFAFLYSTFGALSFFFHSFQLSLHIASACFIFLIFIHYFSKRLSLFLALVFLVHPINQETVAYIANLQDALYFFFGSLAYLLYKRNGEKILPYRKLFLISFFIFLAMLSKVTGVLFLLLILCDCFFNRKQSLAKIGTAASTIIIFYITLKQFATRVPFQIEPSTIAQSDISIRLQTIPQVMLHYLGTFLFPHKLITHQDWVVQSVGFTSVYLPLLLDSIFFILIALVGLLAYKKSQKQFQTFLFFCFWFSIGFLLHIQIIPLDFTVADRWFYFPLVGLLGITGVGVTVLTAKQNTAMIIGISILVLLSCRTITRNNDWRNGLTLYQHDIALAPNNAYLQGLLGNELMQAGKYDEAIVYFNKVAKQKPTQWRNWINLGAAYYQKGNKEKTEMYFKKAIEVGKPQMGYERLSQLYLLENNVDKAQNVLQEGLQTYPQDPALLQLFEITRQKTNDQQN